MKLDNLIEKKNKKNYEVLYIINSILNDKTEFIFLKKKT
jgi:hypothetical protein